MMNNKPDRRKEKREKFKRVASRRTDVVLNDLRLLGNCSNKSTYNYTEEDVRKIFVAIDEQLRITKARFKGKRPKKKFKL